MLDTVSAQPHPQPGGQDVTALVMADLEARAKGGEFDQAVVRRFWSKTRKGVSCWEWQAGCFSDGYGAFRYQSKQWKAHRLSYLMHFGEFDRSLLVCHVCDNPKCVRPDHLFLGTPKDNTDDMVAKGRQADTSGEANGQAKLTEQDVTQIRKKALNSRVSFRVLAKRYGVSESLISQIVKGRVWSDGFVATPSDRRPNGAKLTKSHIRQIRYDFINGDSLGMIAKRFGVSKSHVCRIVNGKTAKDVE